jgi:hypothetical protein
MRAAIIGVLVTEFKAERAPVEPGAYEHPVRIDGRVVNVAYSDDAKLITVRMSYDAPDSGLIAKIAQRFDTELATGKYDALFENR